MDNSNFINRSNIIKRLIFLFAILLVIPFASASIQLIEEDKETYNLNSYYLLKVDVSNTQGFLKSTIYCTDYILDYFVLPVNIVEQETIEIPDLHITDLMLGSCYVKVSVVDYNMNIIELKESKWFDVTDNLNINVNMNKETFLPGERVSLDGDVAYMIGDPVDGFTYNIIFDNTEFNNLESSNDNFDYSFDLANNIKTGEHNIKLEVYDEFRNKGETSVKFYIQAVPTQLKNLMNKLEFSPGEDVNIRVLLYDQAGDLMDEYTTIKVYNSDRGEVLSKNLRTNELVVLPLGDQAVPGEWKIETESRGLLIESKFNVLTFKNLDVYLSGSNLIIKNIGNIKFDGISTIYLNDLSFNRKIKLDVNEIEGIDLKENTKTGVYDVNVYVNNKEYNLGELKIVDDRGFFERTGDLITGNAVAVGVGDFFSSYIAYFIIVVVLIIIFLIWQNKKRKNVNRRREKEIIEGQLKMKDIKGDKDFTKGKSSKGMFSSAKKINKDEAKEFRDNLFKVAKDEPKKEKDPWF